MSLVTSTDEVKALTKPGVLGHIYRLGKGQRLSPSQVSLVTPTDEVRIKGFHQANPTDEVKVKGYDRWGGSGGGGGCCVQQVSNTNCVTCTVTQSLCLMADVYNRSAIPTVLHVVTQSLCLMADVTHNG